MKTRMTALLLSVLLILSLAACAGSAADPAETPQPETKTTQNPQENTAGDTADTAANTAADPVASKVLVVYFSATGTTKGVAEKIAKITNADLYEIKPAQAYTSADLDWNDRSSRSTKEQNDKSARPEIASETLSLDGYTTIYIGYPIWWGEEPRIMDTFAESYDFTGITMIPFCTSGGSGIGRSGQNLEENAKSGNWLDGTRFSGGVSESELQSWIESVK